jgi:hypothetical protein
VIKLNQGLRPHRKPVLEAAVVLSMLATITGSIVLEWRTGLTAPALILPHDPGAARSVELHARRQRVHREHLRGVGSDRQGEGYQYTHNLIPRL